MAHQRRSRRPSPFASPPPIPPLTDTDTDSSPNPNPLPALIGGHKIRLQFRLGPPPSPIQNLDIYFAQDWRPSLPPILYFLNGSSTLARVGVHPAGRVTKCSPIDVWKMVEAEAEAETEGHVGSERSVSPESVVASPEGTPEGTPEPDFTIPLPPVLERPRRRGWKLWMCALLGVLYTLLLLSGRMAFVATSTRATTAPLTPATTIHTIYSNYTHHLLPVLTPLEHDSPIPREPDSIISALKREIHELRLGVISWETSSLRGPELYSSLSFRTHLAQLHDKLGGLESEFMFLHKMVPALTGPIALTVLKSTVEKMYTEATLETREDEMRLAGRVSEALRGYFELMEGINEGVRLALLRIHGELPVVVAETKQLLLAVQVSLRTADDGLPRMWVRDVHDAIDFTAAHMLPLVETITTLITRASGTVCTLDTLLNTQKERYTLLQLTNGVESSTALRYGYGLDWTPWVWLRRWLVEETVSTSWVVTDETVRGLEEALSLPAHAAGFLRRVRTRGQERGWIYDEIRPARPRDRE